jgi:hypothetical protein
VRFLLDLVDESVHRLSDTGNIAVKPFTVEPGGHRLVFVGADVDDARDVADAAVVVRAMHHRDELVKGILDVLVVLAVLVAVVGLPVQEGDDERVFEPDLERVRSFVYVARSGNQVISEQRPVACGVDEDISRFKHRDRVLRRHNPRDALHRIQPARIDQIADGLLDGVERAEPDHPALQECAQVRRNGLSEREPLVELRWIEDRLDAISVDRIGSVALD